MLAVYRDEKFTKPYFLSNTNNGFDFYEKVMGDLVKVDENKCVNTYNPFENDKNPAFSVYCYNDMWRFKDFGDSSYSGDVFAFAALYYDLEMPKDFGTLLRKMYNEVELEPQEEEIELDDLIWESGYLLEGKPFYPDHVGVERAYEYFKQFGITRKVLWRFGVRAITHYYYVNKFGLLDKWQYNKDQLCIVYRGSGFVKLYHPGAPKDRKFFYRGSKASDFVFGHQQIFSDLYRTKRVNRDILLIAAGEKDVMTLTSLGYDAICLNSETATHYPVHLDDGLFSFYRFIVLIYDLDETGERQAKALSQKYGFKICVLPEELREKGGKDVADYVALGLDRKQLDAAINKATDQPTWVRGYGGKLKGIRLLEGFVNSKGEPVNAIFDPFFNAKTFHTKEDDASLNSIQPKTIPNVDTRSIFEKLKRKNTINTELDKQGQAYLDATRGEGFYEEEDIVVEADGKLSSVSLTVREPELEYCLSTETAESEKTPLVDMQDKEIAIDFATDLNKTHTDQADGQSNHSLNIGATPCFSDDIFSRLPEPLLRLCAPFTDKRERDIVLISSLAVTSTLFPTVEGVNSGKKVGTNLFVFISGSAAGGKGSANWSRRLGSGVQRYLKEQFEEEKAKYASDMAAFINEVKKNPSLQKPQEPVRKTLFIPANCSISKMIELLGSNERFGIVFETEADTLSATLKNEWGNFSDVLRKLFHHETVSLARRTGDEFIEVEHPHGSLLLTGTHEQVNSLVSSVENGFFSRLFFYEFKGDVIWKSQFAKREVNLESLFEVAGEQFYRIWLRHANHKGTLVELTPSQIERMDNYFSQRLVSLHSLYGDGIVASVKRACLISFRISMILTVLRYLETNKELPAKLEVHENDFSIAQSIVDTSLVHLEAVYTRMQSATVNNRLNNQQRLVWNALPLEFTRKQFNELLKTINIEYKTGEKYLGDFIQKEFLVRFKQGQYRKLM